ncbi:MAG: hypothetical protein ABIJ16_09760, partial [Bacteroidota bacterium]
AKTANEVGIDLTIPKIVPGIGGMDLLKATDTMKKYGTEHEQRYDPVEGDNWFSNTIHQVGGMSGPMAIGTVANVIAPGSGLAYWAAIGGSEVVDTADEMGIDRSISIPAGLLGGYFYALVENMQIGGLMGKGSKLGLIKMGNDIIRKGLNKLTKKSLTRFGAQYVKTVVMESFEEMAQELVVQSSANISAFINDKTKGTDITGDIDTWKQTVGALNAFKDTLAPMALLALGGAGKHGVRLYNVSQRGKLQAERAGIRDIDAEARKSLTPIVRPGEKLDILKPVAQPGEVPPMTDQEFSEYGKEVGLPQEEQPVPTEEEEYDRMRLEKEMAYPEATPEQIADQEYQDMMLQREMAYPEGEPIPQQPAQAIQQERVEEPVEQPEAPQQAEQEREISKSGNIRTNGDILEDGNIFQENIIDKDGNIIGVKVNDFRNDNKYYQANVEDTEENRKNSYFTSEDDGRIFVYFDTLDKLDKYITKVASQTEEAKEPEVAPKGIMSGMKENLDKIGKRITDPVIIKDMVRDAGISNKGELVKWAIKNNMPVGTAQKVYDEIGKEVAETKKEPWEMSKDVLEKIQKIKNNSTEKSSISPVFKKYGFTAKDAVNENLILEIKEFSKKGMKQRIVGYAPTNDIDDVSNAIDAIEKALKSYSKAKENVKNKNNWEEMTQEEALLLENEVLLKDEILRRHKILCGRGEN